MMKSAGNLKAECFRDAEIPTEGNFKAPELVVVAASKVVEEP